MTRLLLIDDDARLAAMVTDYLRQSGWTVAHAATGADGMRALVDEAPELVILDLMLPDADGLDLCRRIKAESSAAVLMLTARPGGGPGDRRR
jgi:DNA-binding response OmpR family regulator